MTIPGRGGTPDPQLRNTYTPDGPDKFTPDTTTRPSGSWFLPVSGMSTKPGQFTGGAPQWATGSFGYRKPQSKGGHIHKGVDIYAQHGTAVVAPVHGTITSVGHNSTSGFFLKMKGIDGIEYFFAHLGEHPKVTGGTKVGMGNQIGIVGDTGNAKGTQAHLHFEMRKGGKAINPNDWLSSGRQQQFSTISGIDLNSPEELMAWAQEELAMRGMDPNRIRQISAERASEQRLGFQQTPQNRNAIGTSILGGMFDSLSRRQAGGARTPIPRIPGQPQQTVTGESDMQTQTPAEARTPVEEVQP